MRRLSRGQARQLAVRAARLDARPIDDLHHLVGAVAMLRVELTGIVAPAADHVAWSRLGDDYRPGDAEGALAAGRLWEYDWMLRPLSHRGLFLAEMRRRPEWPATRDWMEANEPFARGILDRLGAQGPLTSQDIPDEAVVPWPSSGWTRDRNVTQMIGCLHLHGDLAVVGRAGKLRLWDLAERVHPPTEEIAYDDAHRIRSEHLLAAFGIMRDVTSIVPTELHNIEPVGEVAEIDGVAGRWRIDAAQLDDLDRDGFEGRTAILSPFDRLISDRVRLQTLFGYDYAIEMYKPKTARRWGPFGLPILHGERLIGKVDAASDHRRGKFVVHAVHENDPFTAATRDAVDEQLASLATWQRLDLTR